jgi:pyrroline-5-carboxylate reductase
MNITFIGGGNMASAIISGLVKQPGHRIQVVEPGADKRAKLSEQYGVTALEAPPAAFDQQEVVVLAVKPQQLKDVCVNLAARLHGALVLSIAAGVGVAALSHWLNGHQRIVRVMPNTPAMVGQGVSGVYAPAALPAADGEAARAIMRAVGEVVPLAQESGIDDITCVSGSGPAYVFYFIEAMIEEAQRQGFSAEEARRLVLATFEGAVTLAKASSDDVAVLRANVTSKGGTTERAIARFEAERVKAAIGAGMVDCRARSVELGQLLSQD